MRNTYTGHVELSASGFAEDQTRVYSIPPPQDGTIIDTNTVQLNPQVLRGAAQIRDTNITEYAVGFTLWAQAASDGLFGHHSGWIAVDIAFDYFDTQETMSPDELRQKWAEAKKKKLQAT